MNHWHEGSQLIVESLPAATRAQVLRHDEWLIARSRTPSRISGSDVPAILGFRGSPWDVWARKKGVHLPEPDEATRAVWRRGHLLEAPTLRWYEEDAGVRVYAGLPDGDPRGETHIFITGPEDWMVASPDAICSSEDGGVWGLDAKTAGHTTSDWDIASDAPTPPDHILAQMWWYMACTGLPRWDVACLHRDLVFRRYRIDRDMEVEAAMVEDVRSFRDRYLLGNEEPPLDGSGACMAALRHRHRGAPKDGLSPVSDANDLATIEAFLAARHRVKEAESVAEALRAQVMDIVGEAGGGVYLRNDPKSSITWREQPGARRIDTARLRSEYPEVAESVTVTSEPTRVLRVAPKLEK